MNVRDGRVVAALSRSATTEGLCARVRHKSRESFMHSEYMPKSPEYMPKSPAAACTFSDVVRSAYPR